MLGSHVGRRLRRELVELVGRDAVVDALDDLLGQDLCGASWFLDSVRIHSKSKKRLPTTSSPGDDARRRREGTVAPRDAENGRSA